MTKTRITQKFRQYFRQLSTLMLFIGNLTMAAQSSKADTSEGKRIYSFAKSAVYNWTPSSSIGPVVHWLNLFGLQEDAEIQVSPQDSTSVIYTFQTPKSQDTSLHTILVHGYLEHCGYLMSHINRLLDQGHTVTCMDLPGHGLSTFPEKWSIDTFDRYGLASYELVEYILKENPGSKPNLLCHSTGCVGFLDLLLNEPSELRSKLLSIPNKDKFSIHKQLDSDHLEYLREKHFGLDSIYFLAPLVEVRMHRLVSFATRVLPLPAVPRIGNTRYDAMNRVLSMDPANQILFPTSWTKRYLSWYQNRKWTSNTHSKTKLIVDEKDSVIDAPAAISTVRGNLDGEIILTPGSDHFLWFYEQLPRLAL